MYLTTPHNTVNLIMHPEKGATGMQARIVKAQEICANRFMSFFTPKFSLWQACWEVLGLVGSLTRSCKPSTSTTRGMQAFGGSNLITVKEAIMPKSHNQKLTTHVSKKSTSRFNVISKTGRSIARKVPFSTAIRLKNAQPELSIKFDSMVGVA